MKEKPETIYGRLLESVHISGYSMERACIGLGWLLEDNRWKEVGDGFDDINKFAESINKPQIKYAVDKRKELVNKFSELEATQRATAKALGVDPMTVNRDLRPVANATTEENKSIQGNGLQNDVVDNATNPPATLTKPGPDVIKDSEKKDIHVANNSGENEWYTPPDIIEMAREVMGSIDCDPASSDIANKNVKAKTYYTIDDGGLSRMWDGNVWLNPPYAQPLISKFCSTVLDKYLNREITQACILVNNATETNSMQNILSCSCLVCFPKGRIKYFDKSNTPANTPLQGQAIIYLGKNEEAFYKVFASLGVIGKF